MPPQPHDGLVDMKGLMALLCVKSRSSVYKYVAENPDFPRPCKLSGGTGRLKFKANEIARFIELLKASD